MEHNDERKVLKFYYLKLYNQFPLFWKEMRDILQIGEINLPQNITGVYCLQH